MRTCWCRRSGNPRVGERMTRGVDEIVTGYRNDEFGYKLARRIGGGLMIGETGGDDK